MNFLEHSVLSTECLCPHHFYTSPPPFTHMLKHYSAPNVEPFGGDWMRVRRGHEGGALLFGLVPLQGNKGNGASTLYPVNIQLEVIPVETGKIALSRIQVGWYLDLGLPKLQQCEKKILSFKPLNLYFLLILLLLLLLLLFL